VTIVDVEVLGQEDTSAGQDPRKRDQIMRGARQAFLEKGFDAASMNDIARMAGVSKGTLYVYFKDKERLFIELISSEKREELFRVIQLDANNHDAAAVLAKCGTQLLEILTRPYYIQAMRTVFSIVNRMPEIGAEFWGRGPQVCADRVLSYLEAQKDAGVLDIDDCELATGQFMELAQGGVMRKLLFGIIETPTHEEIERRVSSAVRLFIKAYGRPQS
jgi:AcrR family transcriptional regulator